MCLSGISCMGKQQGLFFDFLNHDGLAKAVFLRDEQKKISEVIADRNYAPGEQVIISYGKFSNAILLLDFGFTLPGNIHDEVQIEFNVPIQDPLYKMKLYLLQKHCLQITCKSGISKCSADHFMIKEVRSTRGTGIPQSLRAAARVLSCTSLEELNGMEEEAIQNDGRLGRRPLKNVDREIQAHQLLLSHITKLIDQYNASVKVQLMKHIVCPASKRDGIRRSMACELLAGELRVLKSAVSWLGNYITTCDSIKLAGGFVSQ